MKASDSCHSHIRYFDGSFKIVLNYPNSKFFNLKRLQFQSISVYTQEKRLVLAKCKSVRRFAKYYYNTFLPANSGYKKIRDKKEQSRLNCNCCRALATLAALNTYG